MKKIFALIGSNKQNSNTKFLVDEIIKKINEFTNIEIQSEIITTRNLNITFCQGCGSCFRNGLCPLDDKDDVKYIKEKIIEADIVILGSPVYAHGITGSMKTLIDRLGYWTHIFRLGGKYGYVVSTTSNNGDITVIDYLADISQHMGLNLIGKRNIFVDKPEELYVEKEREKIVSEIAKSIISYLDIKEYKSNNILEILFSIMKNKYNNFPKIDEKTRDLFEPYFWQNTGLIEAKDFKTVVDKKGLEKNITYNGRKVI